MPNQEKEFERIINGQAIKLLTLIADRKSNS